ncbi:MAG: IclR family transcriptional regulator [Lacisediminihabitans sp.]
MQVVIRALSVLKLLSGSSTGLTLSEIAEHLDLPVTTVHRVLGVLESERFVRRSRSNRRYFLGPAVRDLTQANYFKQSPLVSPHNAVARASQESGETVFLAELSGTEVVCLALAESRHPLRLFVRVGQSMPLHAAAAARTLLAWRDHESVRKLIGAKPLVAYTVDTPTNADEVIEHLGLIRERGYDLCESELDENVWAVSAPVRSSTDDVVASVTLAAPMQRMTSAGDRAKAIDTVFRAAAAMAADLGFVADAGAGS